VPGKARVHELARELGVSSKQILSKAKDLGLFLKSASSTIEAADARRLRDTLTGRTQVTPGPRTWPHRPVGNNPYSPPRPGPPAAVPQPRTPPLRLRPRPMPTGPQPDDDPFAVALRRAQAKSKSTKTTHTPKPNPFVDVILARTRALQYTGEPTPSVVYEWAQMWIEEWFDADDVAAWMDAGLKGNEAHRAAQLCRDGWTPHAWARRGGRPTTRDGRDRARRGTERRRLDP
jgi:hypothetical protein